MILVGFPLRAWLYGNIKCDDSTFFLSLLLLFLVFCKRAVL